MVEVGPVIHGSSSKLQFQFDPLVFFLEWNCNFQNQMKTLIAGFLWLLYIIFMRRVEAAGGTTVRLHTGDPCLYGAIREQMDALDADGIAYDDTPGVSSFCGAAAALNAEYTLPTVSQTVIITRMEGRTPVQEKEKLASLASHGATMVIFLSIGLVDKVQEALLAGGAYTAETPAAVVYKATWPEQKTVRCTVGTLAESVHAAHITKTALIVVGGFLGQNYERSKLYDPAFTTAFRKGTDQ